MKLFNAKGEEIEVDPAQKALMLGSKNFFEEDPTQNHSNKEKADHRTPDQIEEDERDAAKTKLITEINGFTRKELDAYIEENKLEVPDTLKNMQDKKDWIIVNLDK